MSEFSPHTHRLPIDTISGEAVAEASVKGKKKDAVVLCALNACRMLDAHDILRLPAKGNALLCLIYVPVVMVCTFF